MELFASSITVFKFCHSWRKLCQQVSSNIEIYTAHGDRSQELRCLAEDVMQKVPYHPTPYCLFDHHGQLQTGTQYFLRNLSRVLTTLVPHSLLYVHFTRELVKQSDGGTIAIDWASLRYSATEIYGGSLPDDAPVMILHHGLVGDSQSEYIYHLTRKLLQQGYRVGVMIARGCGGLPLTNIITFAGRKSSDVRSIVMLVRNRYSQSKLFWMGFSLGAAATLQYLEDYHGQTAEDKSELDAVMCVSPPWTLWVEKKPFDIWSMLMVLPLKVYMLRHKFLRNEMRRQNSLFKFLTLTDIFDVNSHCYRGFGGLTKHGKNYRLEERNLQANNQPKMTRNMVSLDDLAKHCKDHQELQVLRKMRANSRFTGSTDNESDSSYSNNLPEEIIVTKSKEEDDIAKTMAAMQDKQDRLVQHPHDTLQYRSVEEYYDDCSPVFRAHLITTPTLAISAKDDPICCHTAAPRIARHIGPGLVVVKSALGGHLAFPEEILPLTHAWTDRVAVAWFDKFLK